jgi:hypothetical protein
MDVGRQDGSGRQLALALVVVLGGLTTLFAVVTAETLPLAAVVVLGPLGLFVAGGALGALVTILRSDAR